MRILVVGDAEDGRGTLEMMMMMVVIMTIFSD